MEHFEVYDERTMTRDVKGIPVEFEVQIAVTEDDTDPEGDFDFGDATENVKYLAKFHSGELFMGCIRVTAIALGVEGSDYLAGCHLPSASGDGGRHLKREVMATADDHGMVDTAIADCITTIQAAAQRLKGFA